MSDPKRLAEIHEDLLSARGGEMTLDIKWLVAELKASEEQVAKLRGMLYSWILLPLCTPKDVECDICDERTDLTTETKQLLENTKA